MQPPEALKQDRLAGFFTKSPSLWAQASGVWGFAGLASKGLEAFEI